MAGSVITIAGGKGGVGKTTVTVILASELSQQGKTVCIVDLDQQSTCAIALGLDDVTEGVAQWLEGKLPYAPTPFDGVSLLAGGPQLGRITTLDPPRLKSRIDKVELDYFLIDTGHAWHPLSRLACTVADKLLVVSDPHTLGLTGAAALIQRLPENLPKAFVLSKIDGRRNLHKEIAQQASAVFKDLPVFNIRSDAALERTLSEGLANTRLRRTRAVEDIASITDWITEDPHV